MTAVAPQQPVRLFPAHLAVYLEPGKSPADLLTELLAGDPDRLRFRLGQDEGTPPGHLTALFEYRASTLDARHLGICFLFHVPLALLRELSDAGRREGTREALEGARWIEARLRSCGIYDTLPCPSGKIARAVSSTVSRPDLFSLTDGQWPRALLRHRDSRELRGHVEVRHAEDDVEALAILNPEQQQEVLAAARRHVESLGIAEADTLDSLMILWAQSARERTDHSATIYLDDLLALRGLKKKPGAGGRRGGYTTRQRAEQYASVERLANVWVVVDTYMVPGRHRLRGSEDRLLHLDRRHGVMGQTRIGPAGAPAIIEPEAVSVRFGEALAPYLTTDRENMHLPRLALSYHQARQEPEKRLARYFAWIWRVQAFTKGCRPVRLRGVTLATEANIVTLGPDGEELRLYGGKPGKAQDRLEKALDTLQQDAGLEAWQVATEDSELWTAPGRGWLEARIVIEPPGEIPDRYSDLIDQGVGTPALEAARGNAAGGRDVRSRRRRLGLTQLQLAEESGVSTGSLSNVERGLKVRATTRRKVERALDRLEAAES